MAKSSLGTLTLDLIAKIGGFTGPLDQAARKSKKSSNDISSHLKKIAVGVAGVGSVAGFGLLVKNSIDAGDALYKQSQIIGISVEKLSALKFSAGEAGVEFEGLATSLAKANKNIDEAASTGKGAASDAFKDLGISIKDVNGQVKSTDAIFSEVADRFQQLEDGATKTALAQDIFGKSGKDLIPLLNSGAKGLRDSADEAERLGQIFSTESAKGAEEFNDNLSRLQKSISGVAIQAANEAAPALAEMTRVFADPEVQKSIASLTSGIIGLGTATLQTLSDVRAFVTYLAESLAAELHGIASDDIVRLEDSLKDLQKQLDPDFFSFEMAEDVTVTQKKIKETEERIAAYYKNIEEQARKTKENLDAIDVYGLGDDPFKNAATSQGATAKFTLAQIEANRKLRESSEEAAKAAEAHAKELTKSFESTLDGLAKELAGRERNSKAAELAYELEKGSLKGLDDARAKQLTDLANEADELERINVLKQSQRELDLARMGDKGQLASVQLEYDLKNGLIKLNDRLTEQDKEKLIANEKLKESQESTKTIDEQIKQQQRLIDLYFQKSEAAKLEYDIRNGFLKVEDGIESAQAKQLINNQQRLDALDKLSSTAELTERAVERIDSEFSDIWVNLENGADGFLKGLGDGFKKTLAEMAHQALTKPITIKLQQTLSNFAGTGGGGQGGSGSSGGGGAGLGALGAGGIYAAGALVAIAAVNAFNKKQDAKFEKMTAAYRQGTQSLGTILGESNKKSDSLRGSIEELQKYSGDTLNVNYSMLTQLVAIREGISGVSAGFARQFGLKGVGNFSNINTGVSTPGPGDSLKKVTTALFFDNIGGDFLAGFANGITDAISKNVYSESKKITDTGIKFIGESLADVLTNGVVDALAYADVKSTKKLIGIKVSTKLKTKTQELDDIILTQFADVFGNAGDALEQAATIFGLDFDNYIDKLLIAPQSLSLKGLEGDALTKEIEAFFSSTLDNWAGVLTDGTGVLEKFQKVGEGAFETVIRLASETNLFSDYAEKLNLNFKAVGFNAVIATEELAKMAGGFDVLSSSLNNYADKFFSDSEKFQTLQNSLGDAFSKLGVALPKTREEFRKIVEGIDLSTEAGRQQFANVINLTDATDRYLISLDKENKAKEDAAAAAKELGEAAAGLSEAAREAAIAAKEAAVNQAKTAFDAFSSAIQKDIDKAQTALNASRQVADSLTTALKSMRIESRESELMARRAAQAQLVTANAIAKAGGPLPKAGQLDDALNTVVQPSQELFATFEDYARDFYATAKTIKELEGVTGAKATYDEQNLAALQSALDFYQQEIDKLDNIDTSVLSVKESVDKLVAALVAAGSSTATKGPAIPTLATTYDDAQTGGATSVLSNFKTPTMSASAVQANADIMAEFQTNLADFRAYLVSINKATLSVDKTLTTWNNDGLPLERDE